MPINRRHFLKRFSAALGIIGFMPEVVLEAPAIAPAAAAPLRAVVWALNCLDANVSTINSGTLKTPAQVMHAVDTAMESYHAFWQASLHKELKNLTAEQAAPVLIAEALRRDGREVDMRTMSPWLRYYNTTIFKGLMKSAIGHASQSETEFLDMLMERAARALSSAHTLHHGAQEPQAATQPPPPRSAHSLRLHADAGAECLETLLARDDVRLLITEHGTGLHIASCNGETLAALREQLQGEGQVRSTEHGLTLEAMPHAIRSLARPYIREYNAMHEPPTAHAR